MMGESAKEFHKMTRARIFAACDVDLFNEE
jgi:hypothetical protein